MRYDESDRESGNVEDRRGQSGGGMFRLPGGLSRGGRRMRIPFPMGGRRGGLSLTTLLVIGGIMLLLGINPLKLLTGGGGGGLPDLTQIPQMPRVDRTPSSGRSNPLGIPGGEKQSLPDEELARFTKRVLADTEDVWNKVFGSLGQKYREPKLGAVHRFNANSLWRWPVGDGAILLPAGSKDLR